MKTKQEPKSAKVTMACGGNLSFDDIEYARSMRYSGKRRPGYKQKQKQHQHEGKQKQ